MTSLRILSLHPMNNEGFRPQRIFWIAALISLVGGIFFYKVKMDYMYHDTYFSAYLIHFTAISSGVLSMISFGYNYLMKGTYSKALAILHILATLGLMIAILYFNYQWNIADTPSLDSSMADIQQWQATAGDRMDNMSNKVMLTLVLIGVHILFFGSLLMAKWKRGK